MWLFKMRIGVRLGILNDSAVMAQVLQLNNCFNKGTVSSKTLNKMFRQRYEDEALQWMKCVDIFKLDTKSYPNLETLKEQMDYVKKNPGQFKVHLLIRGEW